MKKILIVNVVCGRGSTGRIAAEIGERYAREGWEVKFGDGQFLPAPKRYALWCVSIGSKWEVRIHQLLTRVFDWHGTGICSYFATRRFIKWAEAWKPDLLWLHNIHGYYLNYPMLFRWIKRHPNMEVKWTLHDCWAFTGHCSHFMTTGCLKWETGCGNCPEKRSYPASLIFDSSKKNWIKKKSSFTGVKRLSLVAPSKWLAGLIQRSLLKEYSVDVIHNTINTSIFRPTHGNFIAKTRLFGKVIVLGVANNWNLCKGLSDFIKLRKLLDDKYIIVLVGLSSNQLKSLPQGIIGLARTASARELAEIYSAADWFVNPTREDNFPTVNLEAKACGCRVITYDTGGASETIEGYDRGWILVGSDKTAEGIYKVIVRHETETIHSCNCL